jgi:hypothetical protein
MTSLPEHVTPIAKGDTFVFACHPVVPCFTECCRKLELSLSPYDVVRLKKALAISSQQFLDEYAVVEFSDEDLYPKVYLGMIDDGQVSCPFVKKEGCLVYKDRPGACRTYPLGRGAYQSSGNPQEIFVLLREPHCQGFLQKRSYTVQAWHEDQGVNDYNRHNDILLPILNSPFFNDGNKLTLKQAELFIMALYNLDLFKEKHAELCTGFSDDDSAILLTVVKWLEKVLFSPL